MISLISLTGPELEDSINHHPRPIASATTFSWDCSLCTYSWRSESQMDEHAAHVSSTGSSQTHCALGGHSFSLFTGTGSILPSRSYVTTSACQVCLGKEEGTPELPTLCQRLLLLCRFINVHWLPLAQFDVYSNPNPDGSATRNATASGPLRTTTSFGMIDDLQSFPFEHATPA